MSGSARAALALLVIFPCALAAEITLPDGFISELVLQATHPLPTAIAFAPEGRIFVAYKSGHVVLHRPGLEPAEFVDLSAEVNTWGDRGLLGIVVHPEFPAKPYVYVLYTYDPPGLPALTPPGDTPDGPGARVSRLERIECDPAAGWDRPLPGGRFVLAGSNSTLENIGDPTGWDGKASCDEGGSPTLLGTPIRDCIPSDGPSHSIGTVAFGTDGMLWMGSGDGARWTNVDPRALRALDPDWLAGKILRIDPIDGRGLPDNPFFDGDPFSNRSRVWSMGLRNPFRFSFHPETGDVYIGDVGWELWEEVNTGRGANFGWPCFEGNDAGTATQPAYQADPVTAAACAELTSEDVTAPLFSYRRAERSAAIVVGPFYTGTAYPAPYRGALFFADYDRQSIRTLFFDDAMRIAGSEDFADSTGGIVQLLQGPDTNLYYVLLGERNEVRRIRFVGDGNHPPVASLRAEPLEGDVPLVVRFSAAESTDPDGDPLTFQWDFGDGASSEERDPVHTYLTAAVRTATLTVRDPSGDEARETVRIFAGNTAPAVEIMSPPEGTTYAIGEAIELAGRAVDERDGELAGDALRWTALLHHGDHAHPDFFHATGANARLVPDDHGDGTWLELRLQATDEEGATGSASRELHPREVELTFSTDPPGLEIVYESLARVTPFTVRPAVGSEREVVTPGVQQHRSFVRWADGAERVRSVVAGESPATYTALYENRLPVARLTLVSFFRDPLAVVLSAAQSSDPEEDELEIEWYPEVGAPQIGPTFSGVWPGRQSIRVRLVVRDALGAEDEAWIEVPGRRRLVARPE
ncbi:MAG: PQQ-dependent sugar dehydrogenase [Thermoanaerobaculia bacterium]